MMKILKSVVIDGTTYVPGDERALSDVITVEQVEYLLGKDVLGQNVEESIVVHEEEKEQIEVEDESVIEEPITDGEGEESDPVSSTPLPIGFPSRQDLVSQGYTSIEQVSDASFRALEALSGIGTASINKIREALAELGA